MSAISDTKQTSISPPRELQDEALELLSYLWLSLESIPQDKRPEFLQKINALNHAARVSASSLGRNFTLADVASKLQGEIRALHMELSAFNAGHDRTLKGLDAIVHKIQSSTFAALNFLVPPAVAGGKPPLCERPTYLKAKKAYREVEDEDQLTEKAGGALAANIKGGIFQNFCSSRLSHVLNETGCKVPKIQGETVSGKNGEQYIYRLTTLRPFLKKAYGPPDCEWKDGELVKGLNEEMCKKLEYPEYMSTPGILIHEFHESTTATGHAEVSRVIFPPDTGMFWKLPNVGDKKSEDK